MILGLSIRLTQTQVGRGDQLQRQELALRQLLELALILEIDYHPTIEDLLENEVKDRTADCSTTFSSEAFKTKSDGLETWMFRLGRLTPEGAPILAIREELGQRSLQAALIKDLIYWTKQIPHHAVSNRRKIFAIGSACTQTYGETEIHFVPYASSGPSGWRYGVEPIMSLEHFRVGPQDLLLLRSIPPPSSPDA